jgi:hypothetical protein
MTATSVLTLLEYRQQGSTLIPVMPHLLVNWELG